MVRRDRLDAFRAEAVFRLRVAAAFLPAATRFGDFLVARGRVLEDFLAVVRLRVAAAFRPAVFLVAVFRERVVAAFLAAVERRLRVAAAFLAAVFRVRDVVAFRRVVPARLRVVAAFLPAATRFGDFLVVRDRVLEDFLAVVRLRVAAAFRPAVFLVAVFRERVVAAFFAAVLRFLVVAALRATGLRVAGVFFRVVEAFRDVRRAVPGDVVSPARSVGLVDGISVVSDRGVGRSHAGVSGRHEGSGAVGASIVLVSWPPPVSSIRSAVDSSVLPVESSHGHSRDVRSGMVAPPLVEVS